MVFWEWLLFFFIVIPMFVLWIYTAIDIFQRPDQGALAKFLWLVLVLFLPLLGMLIYYLARPPEAEIIV